MINNWDDIIVYVALSGYVGVSWHECARMRLISPSVGERISSALTVLDARACKIENEEHISTSDSLLCAMPSFPMLEWLELDFATFKEASTSATDTKGDSTSLLARSRQRVRKVAKAEWGRLRCLSLRGSVQAVSASFVHEIGTQCLSLEVLDVSLPKFSSCPISGKTKFGDSLGNLVSLRFLDLSCTPITDAALEMALRPLSQLSHLGLCGCKNLSPLALQHVCMYSSKTLEVLDISALSGLSDADLACLVRGDFTRAPGRVEDMHVSGAGGSRHYMNGSSSGKKENEKEEGVEAWPRLFCLLASFLKDLSDGTILAVLSIKSLRLLDMRGQGRLVDSEIYDRAKSRDVACLFQHEDVYQERGACFGDRWPPSMAAFRPGFNFAVARRAGNL